MEGKDTKGHIVSRRCPNHGGCLLAGLENDILWHVSLKGVIDGIPSRIGHSGGTPRARSQYAYFNYVSWLLPNFHIFTSWDAADSWIKLNGTQPDALRYRGQSVSDWGQDIRNGFYTYGQSPEYAFVLTRDLDSEFNMDQPYRDPNEMRRSLRRIIWQTDDPFLEISTPHVEGKETVIWDKYPDCRMTNATLKASADDPETTAASFITCNRAEQRGMAVYLEGHGGFALDIGADVIGYLADLGWEVLVLDMPMSGANYYVAQPSSCHFSYGLNDSGGHLPIAKFMMPIKLAIDWALSMSREPQSRLIMIGKSGGGWASTLYSSLDKRIEYLVAIAGLLPQSIRLEHDAPSDTGDYEQHEPALYSYLPYEHLMISAGSKGAFYIYNENDPCCFHVHSDSPFLKFLEGAARAYKKNIGFYIDPDNTEHSVSPKALEAMRVFIDGP